MFKCELCGNQSQPGEKIGGRIATQTVKKEYQNKNSEGESFTTYGKNIVREVVACLDCTTKWVSANVNAYTKGFKHGKV